MQLFLSVYVDDIMSQNTCRRCGDIAKESQFGDPPSPLDQVCLGCTQRAAQVNNRTVMEKQALFSKLTSTKKDVKTEKKSHKDITAWSWDVDGHAQECVERCCELAHTTVDQLYQVFTPCLDDH